MIDINITELNNDVVDLQVVGNTLSGTPLLAQRVLIALLTDISDYLRDGEGSTLITSWGSGVCDVEYTKLLLISAISSVKKIFADDEGMPDDEMLSDIIIQDISVEADRVYVTIVVVSQSGSYQVLTPTIGSSL